MIFDAARGARSRTVLRIRVTPRTRAKDFGWPSRAENPAARTTNRSAGGEASFIGIMPQ